MFTRSRSLALGIMMGLSQVFAGTTSAVVSTTIVAPRDGRKSPKSKPVIKPRRISHRGKGLVWRPGRNSTLPAEMQREIVAAAESKRLRKNTKRMYTHYQQQGLKLFPAV